METTLFKKSHKRPTKYSASNPGNGTVPAISLMSYVLFKTITNNPSSRPWFLIMNFNGPRRFGFLMKKYQKMTKLSLSPKNQRTKF